MTNINTFQGDVFIHEYIKHTGDDNNLFGFSGTDTFKIATAGVDAIKVDADQNVDITGLIRHIGDENNLFGFSDTDTFKIATAATNRLIVKSDGKIGIGKDDPSTKLHIGSGDVGIDRDQKFDFGAGYSSNWYIKQKSADNKLYFERTGGGNELVIDTSGNMAVAGTLTLPDYIIHGGDTHTYFGFNGGDSMVFITGGTTRLTINNSGLSLTNGGTALNYFKETSSGGAWNAHGQNGTGFNINGQVAYQRVGNFCTVTMRRVQFYAQGNFYLRHSIPSEFRPNNGYGEILAWQNRVVTNGAFWGLCYWPNQGNGAPYWYYNASANGSDFGAGNGTQHNFSAHSRTYLTN